MNAHCVFKVIRQRGREGGRGWKVRLTGGFLRYIRVTKAEERKKKRFNKQKYSSSYILSSTYYPTSTTSYFI